MEVRWRRSSCRTAQQHPSRSSRRCPGRADAGVLRSIGSPAIANAPQPRPAAPSEGQLSRSAECRLVQHRPSPAATRPRSMLRRRGRSRSIGRSAPPARRSRGRADAGVLRSISASTSGCSATAPSRAQRRPVQLRRGTRPAQRQRMSCGRADAGVLRASARPAPPPGRARLMLRRRMPSWRSIGWPGTSGCSAAGPTRAFCGASARPAQADAPRIPAAAPSEGQLGRGAECQLAQHKRMRLQPRPTAPSEGQLSRGAEPLHHQHIADVPAFGWARVRSSVALTRAFCGTLARPAQADGPQPRPAAPSEGQLSRGAEWSSQNRPMLRGYPTDRARCCADAGALRGASGRQQKRCSATTSGPKASSAEARSIGSQNQPMLRGYPTAPSEGQLGRGAECQLAQHKRMLRNRARPHPAKASSAEARNLGSSSTRGCSAGPSRRPAQPRLGASARPEPANAPRLPARAQRRPAQLRRGTSAGPAQADAPRPG